MVTVDLLGEHVRDGHQDLVCNGHGSALVAAPSFETIELVAQVSALSLSRTSWPAIYELYNRGSLLAALVRSLALGEYEGGAVAQ